MRVFLAHGPPAVGPPAKRPSFANQAVVKYLATKWPERGELNGNPECPPKVATSNSINSTGMAQNCNETPSNLRCFHELARTYPNPHQPLTRRRWKHAAGVSTLPFIVQPVRVIWRSSSSCFNRCERIGEDTWEDPWGYATQIGRYGVVATHVSKYLIIRTCIYIYI